MRATAKAVISRLASARGNRNFQANAINWSYRKRGKVPRIQMKMKSRKPVFAVNQNSGRRKGCNIGIAKASPTPMNAMPKTGSVMRSKGRAGFRPWERETMPARG